jgi:hypothetical protein
VARTVTVPIPADVRLMEVIRALDRDGVDVVDINRRQATLDDVFLTLTDPDAAPVSDDDNAREEVLV